MRKSMLYAAAALGLLACDRIQVRQESYPDGTRKSRETCEVLQGDTVLHGFRNAWYPDGARESTEAFVHGRQEGYALRWYANGRLRAVEHFTDGERDGQAKYWDAQGKLLACYDAQSGDCLRTAAAGPMETDRLARRP